jgi:hypothetical protein
MRRMGPIVLFIVMQSLGMSLVLAEDPVGLKSVKSRLTPRRTKRVSQLHPNRPHGRRRPLAQGGCAGRRATLTV